MTPIEIVVKLYSETERQLNRAVYFIDGKDYEGANTSLNKSRELLSALRSVLDMDIPVSKNLDSLYDYFVREITTANVKKDKTGIEAILPMVAELRDAFSQIAAMPKAQTMPQAYEDGLVQAP